MPILNYTAGIHDVPTSWEAWAGMRCYTLLSPFIFSSNNFFKMKRQELKEKIDRLFGGSVKVKYVERISTSYYEAVDVPDIETGMHRNPDHFPNSPSVMTIPSERVLRMNDYFFNDMVSIVEKYENQLIDSPAT